MVLNRKKKHKELKNNSQIIFKYFTSSLRYNLDCFWKIFSNTFCSNLFIYSPPVLQWPENILTWSFSLISGPRSVQSFNLKEFLEALDQSLICSVSDCPALLILLWYWNLVSGTKILSGYWYPGPWLESLETRT